MGKYGNLPKKSFLKRTCFRQHEQRACAYCVKGFYKLVTNCSIYSYSARFCHTVWETLINMCQPVIPSQNAPFNQINRLVWGYNGHLCLTLTQFVDTCCSLVGWIHMKPFIPGHKNSNDDSAESETVMQPLEALWECKTVSHLDL